MLCLKSLSILSILGSLGATLSVAGSGFSTLLSSFFKAASDSGVVPSSSVIFLSSSSCSIFASLSLSAYSLASICSLIIYLTRSSLLALVSMILSITSLIYVANSSLVVSALILDRILCSVSLSPNLSNHFSRPFAP